MKKLNRRSFLKSSLLGTTSISLLPAFGAEKGGQVTAQASAVARVIGANDDIRFAVVGFNGRGADHLDGMRKVKGTRLVALCDVDSKVLERELTKCQNGGEQVEGYTDIRKLLENKAIDVVTIATPNHWHSLAAFGRSRPARTFTWRNRSHITSPRGAASSKRRGNTTASWKPALNVAPTLVCRKPSPGCVKGIWAKSSAREACATSGGRASVKWAARSPFRLPLITTCGAARRLSNR